jgi:hypothetical protein
MHFTGVGLKGNTRILGSCSGPVINGIEIYTCIPAEEHKLAGVRITVVGIIWFT